MISIGNDIVALSAINRERTNDIRFRSKFITPTELALYQSPAIAAIPFESFVWLLWSVKESAYKYQKRLEPELLFSPAKIEVQNINVPGGYYYESINDSVELNVSAENLINGQVQIGDGKFYFKSVISEELVATVVACHTSFKNIEWGIQRIELSNYESQSKYIKFFLINKLKRIFPQGNFTLQKSPVGYAVLYNNGFKTGTPISMAHHGHFTSYCFVIDG